MIRPPAPPRHGMPRVRHQLVVQLPPDLLARVRAAAAAQDRTITTVVTGWIEAGLTSTAAPVDPADSRRLLDRIEALEAAVRRLESSPIPAPVVAHAVLDASPSLPPLPDRRLTAAEAEGLLTLPDVAAALGLASQSSLTNWIRRQNGDAVGRCFRGFRLLGKGLLPGAQQPGWLWQRT